MKPRPFPEGCIESLRAELKRARAEGVPKLERVLCIWLRAALGLNAEQVATAIGWSVSGVRHVQALYMKEGDAVFRRPGRGGARRHLLTTDEERSLLRRVRDAAQPFGVVEFRTVHAEVEKAVGRPVPPSTVHRMLDRNRWGRQSLVLIPDRTNQMGRSKGTRRKRSGAWQPVSTGSEGETLTPKVAAEGVSGVSDETKGTPDGPVKAGSERTANEPPEGPPVGLPE